jgi:hypothetical protein
VALKALPDTVGGFVYGLRHRSPVRKAELSRFYRMNFLNFASPWWLTRSPGELLRALPLELLRGIRPDGIGPDVGRRKQYFQERARHYPEQAETLQF